MNSLGFDFGISGKIFISSLFLVCVFVLCLAALGFHGRVRASHSGSSPVAEHEL